MGKRDPGCWSLDAGETEKERVAPQRITALQMAPHERLCSRSGYRTHKQAARLSDKCLQVLIACRIGHTIDLDIVPTKLYPSFNDRAIQSFF